jgi:hypothetical protein
VGTALGGHWLLGAYVVSNVALVVALTVLYRLTERELSDLAARRTVLYLAVFPTAFFLYAPYTESLFLALVLGSLYAARRSAWLLAGGLGALAALTRSTGLLLVLPLVVEAALQAREVPGPGRPRRLARALAATGLVPVGTAAYLLYWHRTAGDALRPLELQSAQWSREGSWPWETLLAGRARGSATSARTRAATTRSTWSWSWSRWSPAAGWCCGCGRRTPSGSGCRCCCR